MFIIKRYNYFILPEIPAPEVRQQKMRRTITAVFITALTLTGLVLFLGAGGSLEQQDAAEEERRLLDVEENQLTEFSYVCGETEMRFVKKDGVWTEARDPEVPMRQDAVSSMIGEFLQVPCSGSVSRKGDLQAYGLHTPDWKVELVTSDGREITVTAGSQDGNGHYYVQTGNEEDAVLLVRSSAFEQLTTDYDSLVEKENFSSEIGLGNLIQVSITSEDYSRIYTSADRKDLAVIVGGLGALQFDRFASYHAREEDMKRYGLDDESATRFTAVYEDTGGTERVLTLKIGHTAEEAPECRYVCREGSDMVALAASEVLENLLCIRKE